MATRPPQLDAILQDTAACGFSMPSDELTGMFVATLAASKPSGRLLELGTGTGLGAAWLLHGMCNASSLVSVDNDEAVVQVANKHLGRDSRFKMHIMDGAEFLANLAPNSCDLIFADTWPGKYTHLDLSISALRVGGILVFDDMLPQPNWPEEHFPKAAALRSHMLGRTDVFVTELNWSTGIMLAVKRDS